MEQTPSYRAHLDGLRAVAVYLVVLFHSGVDEFSGGFVGVDVFFVLSGFLVTQLLLRDIDGAGRVGFGRFYARRFRRLLPAAFVVLVVTGWVFSAVASPVEVVEAEGGFKAAFLYFTNWYFIDQAADYFGADLASNPVLHFWSLAVEEQFYLMWPLVLGGLFAVTRRFGVRQRQTVRATVAVAAVVSLGWALSLRGSDPSHAYYGTDARVYQLLAGAVLALTPGLLQRLGSFARTARWTAVVGTGALVAVATSWVDLDAITRGAIVTVITLILLLALESGEHGLVRRALSLPPTVYLGRISYGTYLWHWPVILVLVRSFDLSTTSTVAFTALVATALASLSYELMEHPVRISALLDGNRALVIATGLALSVVGALVIVPAVVEPTPTTAAPAQVQSVTGFTPVPTDLDFTAIKGDIPALNDCFEKPVKACTPVESSGAKVLLVGDSHAAMLVPALKIIAEEHHLNLTVAVRPVCPWQRGLYVTGLDVKIEDCELAKEDLYDRVIPALDPDVIIVAGRNYETWTDGSGYVGADQQPFDAGSAELRSWVEAKTVTSLAELRRDDREIVFLESTPFPRAGEDLDTLACLSQATTVEECRYVAVMRPPVLQLIYERLDREDDLVWALDLDRLVCPFLPICDPIVNGLVTTVDGNHLTRTFAATLAPALTDLFEQNAILP